MTLNGKAYPASVVCSLSLQRASHSLLVLLQSFGQPWTQPWDHSQALSWNEQVHPLSEQEQAQLIWTAHSRHADDAKFGFLNQLKSSNTNPIDPGLLNSPIRSCAMEHTLWHQVIKVPVCQTVSQPSLYFRHSYPENNKPSNQKRSMSQGHRATTGNTEENSPSHQCPM